MVLYLCVGLVYFHTFAERRWAVPLRGVSWNAVDGYFSDQLISFITKKAETFSSLVTVFVQSLVTIVWHTRIWAWIILHCVKEM